MSKLKYILQDLKWLKVLNSPFKPFRVRFYAGKTQIGTPYFLPRKWVKYTEEDIQEAIQKHKANKNYVQHLDNKLYEMYKGYNKAVPLKVGFSYCGLGWKTKWTNTDFRYEWGPVLSFVFFGYQIALMVGHKHSSHYWEAWLYYEYATDKTKSKRERIEQCKKEFNQTWKSYSQGKEEIIDYYQRILKTKYL
jgi:hypothetical protein